MTKSVLEKKRQSWIDLGPALGAEVEADNRKKSDYPNLMVRLMAMRGSIGQLEREHRSAIRAELVKAAELAELLGRNHACWGQFVDAEWGELKKPKLSDRKNALRHVLRWACGISFGGKKKASFYYCAIAPLVKNGLTGEALMSRLGRPGGLKALGAKHAADKKASRASSEPVFAFAPAKRGKRWHLPMKVEFDAKPEQLFGLSGRHPFQMHGHIEEMMGTGRLRVLAYRFELNEEFDAP